MTATVTGYVVRDIATHNVLYFNQLGQVIFTALDATFHDRALGRVCLFQRDAAEHMKEFTENDFLSGNKAAGRPLEVYRADML